MIIETTVKANVPGKSYYIGIRGGLNETNAVFVRETTGVPPIIYGVNGDKIDWQDYQGKRRIVTAESFGLTPIALIQLQKLYNKYEDGR